MEKRVKLFFIIITFISIVSFLVIKINKPPAYKKGSSSVMDNAIGAAENLYKKRAAEKIDFSSGPCLTNDLMPGWVTDLVHSPRDPVDDLPENQCRAYLEGRASHFVELDLNGNLVRVR